MKDIYVRNFKNIDQSLLLNTLRCEIQKSNFENPSLDDDLSNLLDSTDRTVDQLFQLNKLSKRQLKLKTKPWITHEI